MALEKAHGNTHTYEYMMSSPHKTHVHPPPHCMAAFSTLFKYLCVHPRVNFFVIRLWSIQSSTISQSFHTNRIIERVSVVNNRVLRAATATAQEHYNKQHNKVNCSSDQHAAALGRYCRPQCCLCWDRYQQAVVGLIGSIRTQMSIIWTGKAFWHHIM